MEIHGNAFTVWSVWGSEYQSSVSSGDCPFRRRYLKDASKAPRPHRLTECQHYKETGLRLQAFLSALKVKPGKNRYHFSSSSLKPLECNLFDFNSALITYFIQHRLALWSWIECSFLGVLTFQWLVVCRHLLCCCQRCPSSLWRWSLRGSAAPTGVSCNTGSLHYTVIS